MSTIELLFAFLIIVNFGVLFILVSLLKDIATMKLLTQQLHGVFGNVLTKLSTHEVMLAKVGNAFNELTALMGSVVDKMNFLDNSNQMGSLYRTMDGKFAGSSLEDLLKKIQAAGQEQNYLSQEEIEGLRRLFENDDDDESDDESFNL
jgi:hypothetical protein